MYRFPRFRIAIVDDIPKICQTEKVHSLKINVDKKDSWKSTWDYEVGQFIVILNYLNVKVERVHCESEILVKVGCW